METPTTTVDMLDQTFKTSDGRLLFVKYDSFSNVDRLILTLGNTIRIPFEGKNWDKIKKDCTKKLQWYIKELDAVVMS